MDQYYVDLARKAISDASNRIVDAQSYLNKSGAPDFIKEYAKRIKKSTERLNDELIRLESLGE